MLDKFKGCVTHAEASIQSFIRNPEFAEFVLKEAMADGDMNEIRRIKGWVDEAKARACAAAEA